MKRFFTIFCIFGLISCIYPQIPSGYYNDASGKSGTELQKALYGIIKGHTIAKYDELWTHFRVTDAYNDTIIDIYSTNPNGQSAYYYIWSKDQSVSVSGHEGGSYNREHSFCQSWFGGGKNAPYSDLFHIYPVDGYINSIRNNWGYGEITSPTREFSNGSKFGKNTYPGSPNENSFEPIDDYKGDIARSLFYMSVRYLQEDDDFSTEHPMTYKSQLLPWALTMLMDWHLLDPVSDKERNRNKEVYGIQQNRNPFIDYPELVGKIWGNDSVNPFNPNDTTVLLRPRVTSLSIENSKELKLDFSMPLIASSAKKLSNYAINNSNKVENVDYSNDVVTVFLQDELVEGKKYRLTLKNIQGENLYFIKDTVIIFTYGYPSNQQVLLAWTFDELATQPNTPKKITPEINYTGQEAFILFDGTSGSSDFSSISELDANSGIVLGDPRVLDATAGKSLAVVSSSSNGKSVVFCFTTEKRKDLTLTFACRRTSTGFVAHQWEWSLDGIDYQLIENANTIPDTTAVFQLRTLSLEDIKALNDQEKVYLRLTVDGASSTTGNNRFDNIVLHGDTVRGTIGITNPLSPKKKVLIFPNPAEDNITIRFLNHDKESEIYYVDIYDVNGKHSMHKVVTKPEENLSVKALKKGVFLLKITNEKMEVVVNEKLVIY